MNTEEKAKRYDEALEKARMWKEKSGMPANRQGILDDIFPELAESKDERIRKRLAEYFEGYYNEFATDRNHVNVHWEGLEVKEILAWLEKQSKDSPVLSNSSNTGKVERNPAWSEEDEDVLEDVEEAIINYWHGQSQEDLLDWLKSLKDRVQPQLKQEWSKEDRETIDYLIDYLESELDSSYTKEDKEEFTKEIKLLKSLRPQSQWKPSDLQMECLSDAIKHYNSQGYPAPILKELLNELRKLK